MTEHFQSTVSKMKPIAQIGNFHHIGVACQSLTQEYDQLALLGYSAETQPILDSLQKVRVQFFRGSGPRIELVEPVSDASPVLTWLERGTKFYHIAYEVPVLESAVQQLEEFRFLQVTEPAPAVAFDMRRITFLLSPTLSLVELIEAQ